LATNKKSKATAVTEQFGRQKALMMMNVEEEQGVRRSSGDTEGATALQRRIEREVGLRRKWYK
jgi:hypothetical protein